METISTGAPGEVSQAGGLKNLLQDYVLQKLQTMKRLSSILNLHLSAVPNAATIYCCNKAVFFFLGLRAGDNIRHVGGLLKDLNGTSGFSLHWVCGLGLRET